MIHRFTRDELQIIQWAKSCNMRRARMITWIGTIVGMVTGVVFFVIGVTLSQPTYVGGAAMLMILAPVMLVGRTANVALYGIVKKMLEMLEEAGVQVESCDTTSHR